MRCMKRPIISGFFSRLIRLRDLCVKPSMCIAAYTADSDRPGSCSMPRSSGTRSCLTYIAGFALACSAIKSSAAAVIFGPPPRSPSLLKKPGQTWPVRSHSCTTRWQVRRLDPTPRQAPGKSSWKRLPIAAQPRKPSIW